MEQNTIMEQKTPFEKSEIEKSEKSILKKSENFDIFYNSLFSTLIPDDVVERWKKDGIGILEVSYITKDIRMTVNIDSSFCGLLTYKINKSDYYYSNYDSPFVFIIIDNNLNPEHDNSNDNIRLEKNINSIMNNGKIPVLIMDNIDNSNHMKIVKNILKKITPYHIEDISPFLTKILDFFPIKIIDGNSSELLSDKIKGKIIPYDMRVISKILSFGDTISTKVFYNLFHNIEYKENLLSQYMLSDDEDLDKRNIDEIPGLDNFVKNSIKRVIKQFSIHDPEKPHEGIILYGLPGTGKTMLASIISNSCNRNFIKTSVAEWLSSKEAHMGTTIKAMKEKFQEARDKAPSILFIDELDSLGSRDSNEARSYFIPIINAFIEEIQGIYNRGDVAIIGATNFLDKIDPAIKRKKRLGNHIEIKYPTLEGRIEILKYYLKDVNNYYDIAKRIGVCSPADIEAFSDEVNIEKSEFPDININTLIDNIIMNTLYKKYPDINYNAIRYQLALGIIGQAFVYKKLFPNKKINYLSIKPGLNYFALCDVEEIENHNALDEYYNFMYQLAPFEIRKIYQNKKIKGFDYNKIILPKLYNLDNYKKYMKEHLENSGFNKKTFFDNQNIKKGYKIIKNLTSLKDNKIIKIIPSHINTFLNILDVFVDFSDEKFNQDIIKKAEKDIAKIISPKIKTLSQMAFILEREEVLTEEQFNQIYQEFEKHNPGKIELLKRGIQIKKS